MKYSIDKRFDIGRINGWITNDELTCHQYYVTIRTPERIVYQEQASLPRMDVKAVGLHPTGLCGFSFNAKDCGIREGDFLFVELQNEDKTERITHSFLYAQHGETKLKFNSLEIPRDDFSIMNTETDKLWQEYPHMLALKLLLIRLRRFKRAKGYRLHFAGVDYNYFQQDWKNFYHTVSNYRELIFDNLNIRNLFSITDTIADCSTTPEERCAALALSFYMYHERYAQTLFPLCKIDSLDYLNPNTQHPIWGGMLSNRLNLDDSLDIYLTRTYEVLSNTPLILSFFEKIMLCSTEEKNSIFYQNIRNSVFFTEVWPTYRNKFKSDLGSLFKNIHYLEG